MRESTLSRILLVPARRPRSTLLMLLVLALISGVGAFHRGVRSEFGVEQFVPQGDALFARYQELNEQFGRDDNTVFVFATRAEWFTPEGVRQALALSQRLAQAESVDEVVGPATATLIQDQGEQVYVGAILTEERLAQLDQAALTRLEKHLTSEVVYRDRIISKDGRTLAFAVRLREEFYGGPHHARVVAHVEEVLAEFANSDLSFLVSGGPPTQHAYRTFLRRDALFFVSATGLLLVVALSITFRSLQGVVLPILAIGLALFFTGVSLILSGSAVNLLSSAIPVLVLIVGVSDSIHLLTRYGEELATGRPKQEALERALVVTAHACFLTSVTTSVGFFVLPVSGIPMLADMGVVIGAGVILAYLTSLTVIPACAALLPAPSRVPPPARESRLRRLGVWVMDRPRRVTAVLVALLSLGVALGTPLLRVESRVVDDLPQEHPVVQTRAEVEQRMGGNYPLTFLIQPTPAVSDPTLDADLLRRVSAFQQALHQLPGPAYHSGSLSSADYLSLAWRELGGEQALPEDEAGLAQVKLILGEERLARTVDKGGRFLRLQLRVYDQGTQATFQFLERAQEAFVTTLGDRARLEVQGFTYLAHLTHRGIVWSSMTSFTLDFAIVAILVALLFRSLRLTVLALVPNVFPLLCILSFMGLAGIDLRISSAIVFSIVFGIAVDDTVHFLARYHEERQNGLSPRAAAERTIATTGRAMLFMAFVLASGFAVLTLSAFSPNRVLGLLMAVTLASGLVGDLVLLPALLVLGEKANPGRDTQGAT